MRRRFITMHVAVLFLGVLVLLMPEPTISHHTLLCPICFSPAIRIGGQCLLFVTEAMSWDNAKVGCSARNGKLAIVIDPQAVLDYVRTINSLAWWVDALEGNITVAPSGGCLAVGNDGFANYPCDNSYGFICEVDYWRPPSSACIRGYNNKILYAIPNLNNCKGKCLQENTEFTCRSIEYNSWTQQCALSEEVRASTNQFEEPCYSPGWIYTEMDIPT